jgi:hypothetical protein
MDKWRDISKTHVMGFVQDGLNWVDMQENMQNCEGFEGSRWFCERYAPKFHKWTDW